MKKKPSVRIFGSDNDLARTVAAEFAATVGREKTFFSVAFSGGSTPGKFFRELADPGYQDRIPWEKILFFWADERCVPPDHPESNYGMTRSLLLDKIPAPAENIFRIRGEDDPEKESERYSREIRRILPSVAGQVPRLDWIFLGIGEDGHTASLFPGSEILEVRDRICAAARHPLSGQVRTTMTLPLLNRSRRISFIVTGRKKAKLIAEIINKKDGYENYPAGRIQPEAGLLEFFLDREAGSELMP